MTPLTTIAFLVAGFLGWSRMTRCPATHSSFRCALDAGHTVATPHRWRDVSWWDWEANRG